MLTNDQKILVKIANNLIGNRTERIERKRKIIKRNPEFGLVLLGRGIIFQNVTPHRQITPSVRRQQSGLRLFDTFEHNTVEKIEKILKPLGTRTANTP